MWWILIYAAAAVLAMYLLYISGCGAISTKRAVMFIGSRRGARFASCSGRIRRVLRFREAGVRTFVLDMELTGGDMHIELQDMDRQVILRLDGEKPSGQAEFKARARYYLAVYFESATGSYKIDWH